MQKLLKPRHMIENGRWVHRTGIVHSVNDVTLVSMVKDTDGPAVRSDSP